jgi:DNA-binding winged helix-turn-helix (wHTH) protein/tetratricopeptide (TPR) repeat protein
MSIFLFAQFSFDDRSGSLIVVKGQSSLEEQVLKVNEEGTENAKGNQAERLEVQLRRKVADLLSYLIANQHRIISKEELLSELWLHGEYRENSLTQSIRELRAALGDKAKAPSFIKTYPQRGYQWIQVTSQTSADEGDSENLIIIQQESETHSIAGSNEVAESPEMNAREVSEESLHNHSPNKVRNVILLSITLFFVCLFFWFYQGDQYVQDNDVNKDLSSDLIAPIRSVLVLPFINATDDPSMGWLELGLADMLSIDLQRHDAMGHKQLHVTPPAVANAMLLDAQLSWPTLPVHIRSLLREHDIDTAIFASVRLYKKQQVLDFQIIHAQGTIQQGSISYPSLPAALQSISQQLLHLLNPKQSQSATRKKDNPITSLALAKGMQALQQEGPVRAIKYFQAVLLLEEENNWAKAYSARSSFALGQWHEAETLFKEIPAKSLLNDPSLDAFIHYWLAEIAFRRGELDVDEYVHTAIKKAEQASDAKQMARSYRLKAQISWQQQDWSAHQMWSDKAQALFSVNNELSLEAEKLFYLGSPSNSGLEKSPENDLQKNQSRLLKALNFYQQLDNQSMIAASQFAIAQNYTFDLTTRALALQETLNLYKQLNQPYELAQAFNYAGFYHMQLHDGHTANTYFSQARDIAKKLGAKPLLEVSEFYLAFAMLDQGLDQSALGRHGKDETKLHQAIMHLENFIASNPNSELHGSALVFLGWANTELGNLELALEQLGKAKVLNAQLNMQTTLGYSNYSIMRIHLERGDYHAVIAMADEEMTTRLQAVFLARAYYEIGAVAQAISVLNQFKINQLKLWQPQDELRLGQYQASLSGSKLKLGAEPKAHLVYCESDWQL